MGQRRQDGVTATAAIGPADMGAQKRRTWAVMSPTSERKPLVTAFVNSGRVSSRRVYRAHSPPAAATVGGGGGGGGAAADEAKFACTHAPRKRRP